MGRPAARAAARRLFAVNGYERTTIRAIAATPVQIADSIHGDDAILRAGLSGALTLGAVIGRDLPRLVGVRDADPEHIVSPLRPVIHLLAHGTQEAEPRTATTSASPLSGSVRSGLRRERR